MNKVYKGTVGAGDAGLQGSSDRRRVTVEIEEANYTMLKHREFHSPDGFSWGYGGSGPADLARSILWDHFGAEPTPAIYHEFKFEWVTKWDVDHPFQVTSEEIQEWIEMKAPQDPRWSTFFFCKKCRCACGLKQVESGICEECAIPGQPCVKGD